MGMGNQGKAHTDSEMWLRVLEGDGSAFAELFVLHRDRVFGHSLRLVRTPHEAEDITAMVFLEAWRCRSKVRLVNDSLIGWLLVTTNNVARNRIRSTLRYEQLIRKLPKPETTPDHGDSVADTVDQDRRSQLLHQAYRPLCSGGDEYRRREPVAQYPTGHSKIPALARQTQTVTAAQSTSRPVAGSSIDP